MQPKPNIAALLSILVSGKQQLEDAAQQIRYAFNADDAVGDQLDTLGDIVGEARNGLVDDVFRRYVKARIKANKSSGTIPELIVIAKLIVNDDAATMRIRNDGNATLVLQVDGVALTDEVRDILLGFLRDAVSGAVRIIVESSTETPGTTFKWDTPGRGWDAGAAFLDADDNT